jgi:hypothetical protein
MEAEVIGSGQHESVGHPSDLGGDGDICLAFFGVVRADRM